MADRAPSLGNLLRRLDRWLKRHRPDYHAGLNPGAGPEVLHRLEVTLGRPIPAEVKGWLGWHDGQGPGLMGTFVGSWNLMSAGEIAAALHELKEMRAAEILPLLEDGQGDYLCLAEDGLHEVWQGRADRPRVAGSLAEWLRGFVADVEAGRYEEDPERGEFIRRG